MKLVITKNSAFHLHVRHTLPEGGLSDSSSHPRVRGCGPAWEAGGDCWLDRESGIGNATP